MRAFQPIARRTEAERMQTRWAPPPMLRRVAWYVLITSVAYEVIAGWRVIAYLLAVREDDAYEFSHRWPGSPLLVLAAIAMVLCIPYVAIRPPRPKKKHVPDPALSIRPR